MLCTISFALAEVPKCPLTRIDTGDPESVQRAQLDMIKCLIEMNGNNFEKAIATLNDMHNDSILFNKQLLDALTSQNRGLNISEIIGFTLISLLITFIIFQIFKITWYFLVQHIDCIAETLMIVSYLRRKWLSPANSTSDTLEDFRRSQSVPLLLICFYICRPKPVTVTV